MLCYHRCEIIRSHVNFHFSACGFAPRADERSGLIPMSTPLFVFGTLRRGERNHHYLAGFYDRVLPAVLPGYARIAPLMIAPQPEAEVIGEVFFLTEARYEQTLAGCDQLEEILPGTLVGHEYERRLVRIHTAEGPLDAWAYVQATVRL